MIECIVGIDGGGTKTEAVIADLDGNILGIGKAGTSNYHIIGLRRAIASIMEAIEFAEENAGLNIQRYKVACLGLAGAGRSDDRLILLDAVRELRIFDKVIIKHDAAIALAGATVLKPGVIVIAGTGAMAYGINQSGEEKRSGGWGNILGDEGSAYYIGRKALNAACKAYDGRGNPTTLLDAIIQFWKLKDFDSIIKKVYGMTNSVQDIASIAPLVSKAAEARDEVAVEILKDSARELALCTISVIKGLRMENDKFTVAISGSVFNAGDIIIKPFKEYIASVSMSANIINPMFSPVIGAVLLALQETGVCINKEILYNISN